MKEINKEKITEELLLYFQSTSNRPVTLKTTVNNDLLFVGSDAIILLEMLDQNYGVNLSDFDFDKYFLGDFTIPFQYTYYRLIMKERLYKKDLTIEHLIKVVLKGYWFEP